jgi:predicted kinase
MKLEILIGPIASGKSTYCRRRVREGAVVVNDDSVVTAVHGGEYTLYDKKLKILYKAVEMSIISHALALGRDVIIDRPCMKESTRRRYIEIGRGFEAEVVGVKFTRHAPEVHAERRFKSDGRGHPLEYWLEVAKFHDSVWEEPTEAEGFSKLILA